MFILFVSALTLFFMSACSSPATPPAPQAPVEESEPASPPSAMEGTDYLSEEDTTVLTLLKELDPDSNMLLFDEVEWITLEDQDRIEAIGIDPDVDMPGGFYVYNASEDLFRIQTLDDVEVLLLNWEDLSNHIETDLAGLAERMESYESLYHLTIVDGRVTVITEQYTP